MGKSKLDSKKSTKLAIRQRRVFSEDFKREKVADLVAKRYTINSFCRLWGLRAQTVYNWIYKYSPDYQKGTVMVIQKESEANRTNKLLLQVAELERRLGCKQMELDYLEKLVELASKEFEVDLKKNFSAKL
jgi:transposase-like protein